MFGARLYADTPVMSRTSLVVDADPVQLAATARALESHGFIVTTAGSFDEARRHLLVSDDLSLLVAEVRLGQFNGLHLAFRARARHPNVRILITDRAFDTALQTETNRLGGAYLARPFPPGAFETIVSQVPDPATAAGAQSTRRWPRKQVVNGVQAVVGPREARLLDISYGGLCLEFRDGDLEPSLPSTLDVELTDLGLSLKVHPVWARNAMSSEATLCGGEVIESGDPSLSQWREFVDSYMAT